MAIIMSGISMPVGTSDNEIISAGLKKADISSENAVEREYIRFHLMHESKMI